MRPVRPMCPMQVDGAVLAATLDPARHPPAGNGLTLSSQGVLAPTRGDHQVEAGDRLEKQAEGVEGAPISVAQGEAMMGELARGWAVQQGVQGGGQQEGQGCLQRLGLGGMPAALRVCPPVWPEVDATEAARVQLDSLQDSR